MAEQSCSLLFVCFGAVLHSRQGVLVPQPRLEPVPQAVETWHPNHWISRLFLELPPLKFIDAIVLLL